MVKIEKKVSIAIIDSGIEPSVSDLDNFISKSTGFGINSEGFIAEFPNVKPNGLHGTSVALIIRDFCKNVEFTSINILNERLSTDSRIMIYAMNEALKLKPDIIHMSIGTTNWRYRWYMKKIVGEAIEMNIIVVASFNNIGFWPTYPACINGVIGVKSALDRTINKNTFFKKRGLYYAPFSMIEIYGTEKLDIAKMTGTSIAAAYITGHIANIITMEGLKCVSDIVRSLDKKTNKKNQNE